VTSSADMSAASAARRGSTSIPRAGSSSRLTAETAGAGGAGSAASPSSGASGSPSGATAPAAPRPSSAARTAAAAASPAASAAGDTAGGGGGGASLWPPKAVGDAGHIIAGMAPPSSSSKPTLRMGASLSQVPETTSGGGSVPTSPVTSPNTVPQPAPFVIGTVAPDSGSPHATRPAPPVGSAARGLTSPTQSQQPSRGASVTSPLAPPPASSGAFANAVPPIALTAAAPPAGMVVSGPGILESDLATSGAPSGAGSPQSARGGQPGSARPTSARSALLRGKPGSFQIPTRRVVRPEDQPQ
jgi:hypothetical protein